MAMTEKNISIQKMCQINICGEDVSTMENNSALEGEILYLHIIIIIISISIIAIIIISYSIIVIIIISISVIVIISAL